MLNLLTNSLPVYLLYSFLHTLNIIMFNSSPVFLTLWVGILISLVCTATIKLIYLVLNLSVLSLLAVTLWAVSTEIAIVFIVYILAFVGAVIMLFLSVVLMLPASAFTPRQNLSLSLVIVPTFMVKISITLGVIVQFVEYIVLLLIILFLSVAIYFVLSVYYNRNLYKDFTILPLLCPPKDSKSLNDQSDWTFNIILSLILIFSELFEVLKHWLFGSLESLRCTVQKELKDPVANTGVLIRDMNSFHSIRKIVYQLWQAIILPLVPNIDMIKHYYLYLLEVFTQAIIKVSVFLTACPSIYSLGFYSESRSLSGNVRILGENFIAIKNILYVEAPILLFVSVVGLLIALIGAAVLSRPNNVDK